MPYGPREEQLRKQREERFAKRLVKTFPTMKRLAAADAAQAAAAKKPAKGKKRNGRQQEG